MEPEDPAVDAHGPEGGEAPDLIQDVQAGAHHGRVVDGSRIEEEHRGDEGGRSERGSDLLS